MDMKEEEEIFAHLMVLFGNPKLLLAQHLEEAKGWNKCTGTGSWPSEYSRLSWS